MPSPGGVLASTDEWVVTHHRSDRGRYPGRLMISLRRHVGTFSGLTEQEAAGLGGMVRRVTQALEELLRPARVYLASFNEGSAHVHLHLLIRHPDETEVGAPIVGKRMSEPVCTFEEAEKVALSVKEYLASAPS
jgi:diadenosine tetraphosphate (Ap4A) HIT family hydrolase